MAIQIERETRSRIGVVIIKQIPAVIRKGARLYTLKTMNATKMDVVKAIVKA